MTFFGLRAFDLALPIMDACVTPLSFWPGDDVDINTLETGGYKKLSKTRLGKVRDFVTGDEFRSIIFKAAISSLPRWRYARELNKKPRGLPTENDTSGSDSDGNFDFVSAPKKIRGVARAQRGFLDERRGIFHGKHDLDEYLVNRESDSPIIRLEIWRSIVSGNVSDRNVNAYLSYVRFPTLSPIVML